MSIGHNIKIRREELGLYQSELAQRVSVSKQYISFIEQGRKSPGLSTLVKLAKVFNCTLDDLVSDEMNRKAV